MIRRGWYMGGDGFRGRLLKRVKEGVQRAVWINHGAAKRAHGEAEAERLLEAGMAALGVSASQLAETGKGTWRKRRRWPGGCVSGRRHGGSGCANGLCMGEVSAVTRAMGMFKSGRDAKVERMKKRLEELSGEA